MKNTVIKTDRNPKHFPYYVEYIVQGYRNEFWEQYRGFNSIGDAKEFVAKYPNFKYLD